MARVDQMVIALAMLGLVAGCFASVESSGVYGVDTAGQDVYESGWTCLQGDGFTFGIVRVWHSYGAPDDTAPHALANAWVAGMDRMDVYMFPCYSCGDGAGQVEEAVDYLRSYNSTYDGLWLDIEGGSSYWSTNVNNNQAFFEDMLDQANKMNQNVGVYTSESQWGPIMGNSYTGGSRYPLWYAHYDNNPSFSDFSAFGGWNSPSIKQYSGDDSDCGYGLDKNWAENIHF